MRDNIAEYALPRRRDNALRSVAVAQVLQTKRCNTILNLDHSPQRGRLIAKSLQDPVRGGAGRKVRDKPPFKSFFLQGVLPADDDRRKTDAGEVATIVE